MCQLITMLPTSVSPNVIVGSYRSNVIPSEAKDFGANSDPERIPESEPHRFVRLNC